MNYIKKLEKELPSKVDYLLVCASFEDRCLSFTSPLIEAQFDKVGVFYFDKFEKYSKVNIEKLTGHFQVDPIPLDYSNPVTTADSLISFFNDSFHVAKKSVVVDISTFTRESLLITLKFLEFIKEKIDTVHFFYRTAEVSKSLSDGVVSIRSVMGYMGDVNIEDPLHLIILSGFEHERAKEIIDTLEPDHITIGYASKDGSISEDLYRSNIEFTNTLIAYYSDTKIDTFEHSLRDPESSKNEILKAVGGKSDFSTVVAPLNNKISTVGAGLAAISDPRIQLCYAEMANYNVSSYSKATDDCYIFKIPL
ncbi:hypothetical protein A6779_12065 [Marinobacter adhaerens]|uniref:hypothetical protein n=1 Tax=Marinobacter adhaerens TaxID=1033846 RepID=UPI000840961E|nr:hypothetical protein [Marinobacter adhaerens]ODM29855.1 hypothetical protein A6779_12065 [Marinobacter adhaerens]